VIYTDKVGHLITDGELHELHSFAVGGLGLKYEWFQDKKFPHYDLTTARMRKKALNCGAKLVSSREIVRILKARKEM
jgi:hypothetical protein